MCVCDLWGNLWSDIYRSLEELKKICESCNNGNEKLVTGSSCFLSLILGKFMFKPVRIDPRLTHLP